jgi:hypothetical protein
LCHGHHNESSIRGKEGFRQQSCCCDLMTPAEQRKMGTASRWRLLDAHSTLNQVTLLLYWPGRQAGAIAADGSDGRPHRPVGSTQVSVCRQPHWQLSLVLAGSGYPRPLRCCGLLNCTVGQCAKPFSRDCYIRYETKSKTERLHCINWMKLTNRLCLGKSLNILYCIEPPTCFGPWGANMKGSQQW